MTETPGFYRDILLKVLAEEDDIPAPPSRAELKSNQLRRMLSGKMPSTVKISRVNEETLALKGLHIITNDGNVINEIEIIIEGFPTLGVYVYYPILQGERNRHTSSMAQNFEAILAQTLLDFGFSGISKIEWLDGSGHICIFSCNIDKKTLNLIRSYLESVGD